MSILSRAHANLQALAHDHSELMDEAGADGLDQVICTVDQLIGALTSLKLAALRLKDESGAWRADGSATFEAWRAKASGQGIQAAHRDARVARDLGDLSATSADLAGGRITPEHAAVISRFRHQGHRDLRDKALADGVEDRLLKLARRQDAGAFAKSAARIGHLVDSAALGDEHEQVRARRYLRLSDRHGGLHGEFFLDKAAGTEFRIAIEAQSERPAKDDDRTAEQRAADALAGMASLTLDSGVLKTGALVRPHVGVIMTEDTLAQAEALRRTPRAAARPEMGPTTTDGSRPSGGAVSDGAANGDEGGLRDEATHDGERANHDHAARAGHDGSRKGAYGERTGRDGGRDGHDGDREGPDGATRGDGDVGLDSAHDDDPWLDGVTGPAAPDLTTARALTDAIARRGSASSPPETETVGEASASETESTDRDPTDVAVDQTHAERLARINAQLQNAPLPPGQPAAAATVTVTSEELAALLAGAPIGAAEFEDGTLVPPQVLARILCDCLIGRIVVDAQGQPIDLGQEERTASRELRLAILARDRTCRWPGCTRPARWSDYHHLVFWSAGGRTSVLNGIHLCRHHHETGVHRRGAIIVAVPGGFDFHWSDGTYIGHTDHATRPHARRRDRGRNRAAAPPDPALPNTST